MIRIDKINKYFYKNKKNQLHVINNTSLELPDKGLVTLLGPSGSGKTTLLNVIGGLDDFNSGSFNINGSEITKRNYHKMDKIRNLSIGYIFQDYKLIDDMNVFDNVAISLKMCGIKDKSTIKERVDYVLGVLDLYRYRKRPASTLSGGERQRVGIARAIAKNPDIVICDEPTGNLDSKNSIEIMNIIKYISKERLVILVTHEVELAKFYADRIIELEDGKIINDYKNEDTKDLDYSMDNKIYLKDMKDHQKFKKDGIEINYYSDDVKDIKLNLVVRDGNIYIETENVKGVEVINESSAHELVDDHYKKIDKSIYEKYQFKMGEFKNKKYSSVYNMFSMLKYGWSRIKTSSKLKKIYILCVAISAALVMYSMSSMLGITNIHEEDYLNTDKSYVLVDVKKNGIKAYEEIMKNDNVNYVLPIKSIIDVKVPFDYYYQVNGEMTILNSIVVSSINNIKDSDLIAGHMPQNKNEIVVDKMLYEKNKAHSYFGLIGVLKYEDLLGKYIILDNDEKYYITGITDSKAAIIYTHNSELMKYIRYSNGYDAGDDELNQVVSPNLYNEEIKIESGKLPIEKLDIMLPSSMKGQYNIGDSFDEIKIDDKTTKVVGFHNLDDIDDYILSDTGLFNLFLSNSDSLTVSTTDKEEFINRMASKYTVKDLEKENKKIYMLERNSTVQSILLTSAIFLAVTLGLVYMMVRASFLSRIKEVGILRAIGIKKSDIYRMFAGEIVMITLIGGGIGSIGMYYILRALSNVSMFSVKILINPAIGVFSFMVLFLFHLVVGLLPVYFTIRKTPASILSRKDV
ncbi:MAG: ABC transporter ATP-binding protein/permease [Bacilli bacterium]|nr:ABC transporter ATP-binding protein/permease [Bacilli bacterium]